MAQYNAIQYNEYNKKNTLTKLNIRASPVLATRRLVFFILDFAESKQYRERL